MYRCKYCQHQPCRCNGIQRSDGDYPLAVAMGLVPGVEPQKVFQVLETPFNALGSNGYDELQNEIRKAKERGEKIVIHRRLEDWTFDSAYPTQTSGRPCKEDIW